MTLKENHLKLLEHLAQFESLDYLSCLRILDTESIKDRTALSYVFRPLARNDYVRKHKDGSVNILAKGKALFPDIKPLVTTGGGTASAKRINTISRVAMYLGEVGIRSYSSPEESNVARFAPSTCWRKIRQGILSTTRFAGILFVGNHRLAVYDIGDGTMEWQLRAERSLFHRTYSEYKTHATGMLFICDDGKREIVAERIIRTTMWHRKQLLTEKSVKTRDKPVRYSKAPIRLVSEYDHVYLTTPELLKSSINEIEREIDCIADFQGKSPDCYGKANGDYEQSPYRVFVNITTDLLKYVYFFAAAKEHIIYLETLAPQFPTELKYAIVLPKRDFPILEIYPDVLELEGLYIHEYEHSENA